jgi:agmatine/peptidylarginine deiminase
LKYLQYAIVLIFICNSCKNNKKPEKEIAEVNYYTQSGHNRMAAEWEPAAGALVVWPLAIPYRLVIELAKDDQLFTLVQDEKNRRDAIKWFLSWGMDTSKVKFIFARQGEDAWWVRDWGPPAVFSPEGKMKLADGKYIYSTPLSGLACDDSLWFFNKPADNKIILTETDDRATKQIGKELNLEVLNLPFINTGGNVMTDGQGTAFSTCILTNENRFDGLSDEKFFALNKQLLGIEHYNILSNFGKRDIQHIDCFMKLLDEERILVSEPPANHGLHEIYENIVNNELSKLKTIYGRPYQVLRIKTYRYDNRTRFKELLAAYTNSLILNKTIYVPLFGIPGDSIALKRWAEVMPGYQIKGFEFKLENEPCLADKAKEHYKGMPIGWYESDALHCRTRAVWDTDMVYMSVKRIDAKISPGGNNTVFVTIIDYSKKGLKAGSPKLYWRLKGEYRWNEVVLNSTENNTHFHADIPFNKAGNQIEYYVSANSNSGRNEAMPRTAPAGFYSFLIK